MHCIRLVGVSLMLVLITGCKATIDINDDRSSDAVYIDTATGQPIVTSAGSEMPAIHPGTGNRTLMPALFCNRCRKWYPVPPVEQINRVVDAALCPEHHTPLVADGPWPNAHRSASESQNE